jgi:hypothetical protein
LDREIHLATGIFKCAKVYAFFYHPFDRCMRVVLGNTQENKPTRVNFTDALTVNRYGRLCNTLKNGTHGLPTCFHLINDMIRESLHESLICRCYRLSRFRYKVLVVGKIKGRFTVGQETSFD